MRRGTRSVFLVLLISAAAVLAACGGESEGTPDSATGVITEVSWNEDRTEVRSFLLEGQESDYEVWIDPDVDYGFDLSHLEQHRATQDPVVVALRQEDGKLFAERIEDA